MNRRFYLENEILGDSVIIEGPDARHITTVNRLGVDDSIVLFDGSGQEFEAKITKIDKNRVAADIVRVQAISRESQNGLVLAVALPKGDRQKLLVEKLVELGVSSLIPINCQRSVAVATDKSVDRLNRRVIEASKQCGRNTLMEIRPPKKLSELVDSTGMTENKLIAHPYGDATTARSILANMESPASVVLAIGPEGGWTDLEVDLACKSGWQPISLGKTILRVETAATAAAALFGIGRET